MSSYLSAFLPTILSNFQRDMLLQQHFQFSQILQRSLKHFTKGILQHFLQLTKRNQTKNSIQNTHNLNGHTENEK